jgi:hypothetical protein
MSGTLNGKRILKTTSDNLGENLFIWLFLETSASYNSQSLHFCKCSAVKFFIRRSVGFAQRFTACCQ